MEYKYKKEVGDSSNDGHGMSEVIYVTTTHDSRTISSAYTSAARELGHSVFDDLCRECDANRITGEVANDLISSGIPLEAIVDEPYDDGTGIQYYPGAEGILKLYLEIAKLHLPELQYKVVKDTTPELFSASIGYGVFTN